VAQLLNLFAILGRDFWVKTKPLLSRLSLEIAQAACPKGLVQGTPGGGVIRLR
jgi:hypothetical protein